MNLVAKGELLVTDEGEVIIEEPLGHQPAVFWTQVELVPEQCSTLCGSHPIDHVYSKLEEHKGELKLVIRWMVGSCRTILWWIHRRD